MPWDLGYDGPQHGCRHGDGTELAIYVRVPRYTHCPNNCDQTNPGASITCNPAGNPGLIGRCSVCNGPVNPHRFESILDRNSGTMVFDGQFPAPGYSSPIYRCTVCGHRFCNAPAFGAQGDSFFCGTAGNMWR